VIDMERAVDMTDEKELSQEEQIVADYVKLKMLQHMAEGLEDEADGLHCRADALAEEEFLVVRNIDEHQTEINRLLLKLQGVRSARYDLLEKIDRLRSEASVLREKVWTGEDELAINSLEKAEAVDCSPSSDSVRDDIPAETCYEGEVGERRPVSPKGATPVFFRMLGAANAPARASALANCQ
jgi:chromosome segregation ATPase